MIVPGRDTLSDFVVEVVTVALHTRQSGHSFVTMSWVLERVVDRFPYLPEEQATWSDCVQVCVTKMSDSGLVVLGGDLSRPATTTISLPSPVTLR